MIHRSDHPSGATRQRRRLRGLVAVLAVCALVLAACGRASAASTDRSVDAPASDASPAAGPSSPLATGSSPAPAAAADSAGAGGPAAGAPSGLTAPAAMPSSASQPAGSVPSVPTLQIVVIGDSLTSGLATPGYPWTIPAQQILDADDLPAHIVNSSVSGIGYDNDGGVGITFEDLVRQVVTARTGIVVLFGSDNDSAGDDLDAAVDATVDQVQKQAPHAQVVVVGPPVTPAQKGADLSGIDSALRTAADRAGATYVDAGDWFEGKSSQLLSSDGEHPNDAGEEYLGRKFADLLEPMIRARLSKG